MKDCVNCRYFSYGANKKCRDCQEVRVTEYSNWTPREEKKMERLEDKSGHNILKIYQFPAVFKTRTLVLYEGDKQNSWKHKLTTKQALCYKYEPFHHYARLGKECLDGKHEQYCVWRREEGMKDNQPEPFWIVWCPTDKLNTTRQYSSQETAEKQAEVRALERRHDKFFVMRVDSRFRCQEVVKTEYRKD